MNKKEFPTKLLSDRSLIHLKSPDTFGILQKDYIYRNSVKNYRYRRIKGNVNTRLEGGVSNVSNYIPSNLIFKPLDTLDDYFSLMASGFLTCANWQNGADKIFYDDNLSSNININYKMRNILGEEFPKVLLDTFNMTNDFNNPFELSEEYLYNYNKLMIMLEKAILPLNFNYRKRVLGLLRNCLLELCLTITDNPFSDSDTYKQSYSSLQNSIKQIREALKDNNYLVSAVPDIPAQLGWMQSYYNNFFKSSNKTNMVRFLCGAKQYANIGIIYCHRSNYLCMQGGLFHNDNGNYKPIAMLVAKKEYYDIIKNNVFLGKDNYEPLLELWVDEALHPKSKVSPLNKYAYSFKSPLKKIHPYLFDKSIKIKYLPTRELKEKFFVDSNSVLKITPFNNGKEQIINLLNSFSNDFLIFDPNRSHKKDHKKAFEDFKKIE